MLNFFLMRRIKFKFLISVSVRIEYFHCRSYFRLSWVKDDGKSLRTEHIRSTQEASLYYNSTFNFFYEIHTTSPTSLSSVVIFKDDCSYGCSCVLLIKGISTPYTAQSLPLQLLRRQILPTNASFKSMATLQIHHHLSFHHPFNPSFVLSTHLQICLFLFFTMNRSEIKYI